MQTKTFFLEQLQGELMRAFKWMGEATKFAQEGNFQMAAYDMTVAMQHWIKCQNLRDRYIKDEDAEELDWKFFTKKAIVMARKELKEEE